LSVLRDARLIDPDQTSREEAPEEMIFLLFATRLFAIPRNGGEQSGTKGSDHPKKGRGTSDGLAPSAGRAGRKRSEPPGSALE
jgi:hypothetical protein